MTTLTRTIRRAGLVALASALTLGLLAAPAVASGDCLVGIINEEKAFFGTSWGHDAVSVLARNPKLFEGASNLGEIARFLARASAEDCPTFEAQ